MMRSVQVSGTRGHFVLHSDLWYIVHGAVKQFTSCRIFIPTIPKLTLGAQFFL